MKKVIRAVSLLTTLAYDKRVPTRLTLICITLRLFGWDIDGDIETR